MDIVGADGALMRNCAVRVVNAVEKADDQIAEAVVNEDSMRFA